MIQLVKWEPLTYELLKRHLLYNPDTGDFLWIKNNKKAGHLTKRGYITIFLEGKNYKAHRLAWLYMTGKFPIYEIDHEDKNSSNNKFANLRDISHSENAANGKRRKNSWGTGVSYRDKLDKFEARINITGRYTYLGLFDTQRQASDAYENALKDRLNAIVSTDEKTRIVDR